MDTPMDSVDNIPYTSPDRVKGMQKSEKDKQRKFSKALKEKMEEDQGKKKKTAQNDELLLEREDVEPEESAEEQTSGESGDDSPLNDSDDSAEATRIDVRA